MTPRIGTAGKGRPKRPAAASPGALNTAGVAVQGQAITGTDVKNSVFTGNRTAVDINNSNGNSVHNNVIDSNRTGMVFRNQTDSTTVSETQITNNYTLGIVFL